MTTKLDIDPNLAARIDALAARSNLSASEIVAEALEHGHSIAWLEHFHDKVTAAIDAADRDDFASSEDIERVLNKFRPAR